MNFSNVVKMMKKYSLVLIIMALSLIAFVPSVRHTIASDLNGSKTVLLEVNGNRYDIPKEYFDKFVPKSGVDDGFLLEVLYPDFTPTYTEGRLNRITVPKENEYQRGWVLLLDPKHTGTPAYQFEYKREHLKTFKFLGLEYGLKKYFINHDEDPLSKPINLYVQYDDKLNVVGIIECTLYTPSLGCNQKFVHEGLIYELSYRRNEFLPQWQLLQERAIALITSFKQEKAPAPAAP